MQAYNVPLSEAPPQGAIYLTYRFFSYIQSYLIIGKNLSYTNYMYNREINKPSCFCMSAYEKATIHF